MVDSGGNGPGPDRTVERVSGEWISFFFFRNRHLMLCFFVSAVFIAFFPPRFVWFLL